MEYRNLGKSGLRVSELSYGSWVTFSIQLDKAKAKKTMKHAYDKGINFFDTAALSFHVTLLAWCMPLSM